jgi:hypothetical protein
MRLAEVDGLSRALLELMPSLTRPDQATGTCLRDPAKKREKTSSSPCWTRLPAALEYVGFLYMIMLLGFLGLMETVTCGTGALIA